MRAIREVAKERIEASEAGIWWKITEVWWYANKTEGHTRVHRSGMKAIHKVIVEMARNLSTNQRPKFVGKPLEHGSILSNQL